MLRFNFEKGRGYDYEMNTSMDQAIMGQTMKMDMAAYYSMDVKDDDGSLKTITSTVDRFKIRMDMGSFSLDVDTDKPMQDPGFSTGEKNPLKMVNAMLNAIKGQSFTMKVNQEGKVMEVTGFENMAKSIVDSMGVDAENREQMMEAFNKQFNAKKMTTTFERAWYIFPNKEVKVGDSWEKTTDLGEDGAYHSKYKVTDIEGDMVTLNEDSEVTGMGGGANGVNMKGKIDGTIVVDSKIGLIVSADQDLKMKSEVNGKSFEITAKTKIKGKAR